MAKEILNQTSYGDEDNVAGRVYSNKPSESQETKKESGVGEVIQIHTGTGKNVSGANPKNVVIVQRHSGSGDNIAGDKIV